MSYSTYRHNQAAPSELLADFMLLGQAFGSALRSLTRIRFEAPRTDYRGY